MPCDAGDARIFSKEETGLYYYGARYLDPKYSRWLSGDPALNDYIPKAPINDEAKKHNENLPGLGGVFNVVNLHVYHYAGNNPVKYIDPDGRLQKNSDGGIEKTYVGRLKKTFGESSTMYEYDVFLLYTDKGSMILGFVPVKNTKKSDIGGEVFANKEYILFPNNVSHDGYEEISAAIGASMSKTANLNTLLQDECTEINKNDVRKGDLIVQNFKINDEYESLLFAEVSDVKKNIFGTAIYYERNGQTYKFSEKNFMGEIIFWRKNEE
nr:RHS repeat-associated core domain-containing protein [Treponema sp. OMZ 788]